MASGVLSWSGFLLRLAGAVLLVFVTYNPDGLSYFHWVFRPGPGEGALSGLLRGATPLKAFAGLALLAAWVIFLQATRRSLGAGGALLVVGLFACTIWAMVYYGMISPTSSKAIAYLILTAVSLVLAIGISWSHISRRLSGQQDIDEVG